jgi:hypothetical protein
MIKKFVWTKSKIDFLIEHYPNKGKMWCCKNLSANESQIRYKAACLKLRINLDSAFYKEAKIKASKTATGKKRPEQSKVMQKLWISGKIKPPVKKERICAYCTKIFYRKDPKNHRKTCSDICAKELSSNQWNLKEHPAGMKGKIQSKAFKNKMSARVKSMWQDPNSKFNSLEISINRSIRNSKLHEQGILGGVNSYSKCKRGWYDDGIKRYYMRSSWELNYACYLNFLVKQKEIKEWEYEVDTFRFDGIKQGIVSYKPDFKVFNNNDSFEYHEVKGWMDSKSKTKIKRMAKYHPDVKLIIIGAKEYKSIARSHLLFEGWK